MMVPVRVETKVEGQEVRQLGVICCDGAPLQAVCMKLHTCFLTQLMGE